jgi:hypothetical protein
LPARFAVAADADGAAVLRRIADAIDELAGAAKEMAAGLVL